MDHMNLRRAFARIRPEEFFESYHAAASERRQEGQHLQKASLDESAKQSEAD